MANHLDNVLNVYYSKRAKEYEKVYNRPNRMRLQEQELIAEYIKKSFKNRYVLELACGTGYWTKYLLKSAYKIVAVDASSEMLKIASSRYSSNPSINFLQMDAYNPPKTFPLFSGAMACFWFSHIHKKQIHRFLKVLHTRLTPASFVLFVDNVYRKGLGGKLIVKKGRKDTWKQRRLDSGENYEILKNYYNKDDLERIFFKYTDKIEIQYLSHFWLVGYFYY